MKEGQTQEPCNGNCGMNYCDEYGCIENKPLGNVSHFLTPPQEPVGGMDWIDVNDRLPIEEKYYHTKGSDMCCYWHSDTKKFDLKGVTHWLDESYTPPDVEGWINVENCLPELNLEYNVAWDVDGGELVTTTMEFNVKSKSWYDVINGGVDVTEQVKFWMPLPKPPKAGYSSSLPQSSTGGLPKLDQPILDDDDVKGIIESSTEEEKELVEKLKYVDHVLSDDGYQSESEIRSIVKDVMNYFTTNL